MPSFAASAAEITFHRVPDTHVPASRRAQLVRRQAIPREAQYEPTFAVAYHARRDGTRRVVRRVRANMRSRTDDPADSRVRRPPDQRAAGIRELSAVDRRP